MSRRRQPWQPDPRHPRCPLNGKLRYRTMEAAENAMARILLHGSPYQIPRRTYSCDACGGWHLTSQELDRPNK